MRNAALGLALVASTQLTVLSSPAFAQDTSLSTTVSLTPTEAAPPPPHTRRLDARRTGFVVLGIGGAATIAGIVLDIVGTSQGTVSGSGGAGDPGTTSNARTNFYSAGTALIVAGIVTGIVGGSFLLRRDDRPAPPAISEGTVDSATKTVQAAVQRAPSVTVPVVGATF
jgi:hypothetical protein